MKILYFVVLVFLSTALQASRRADSIRIAHDRGYGIIVSGHGENKMQLQMLDSLILDNEDSAHVEYFGIHPHSFSMGVKTNLIYDALLVPNISVELALPRHWSAALHWAYAWWNNDARHRYWRIYGGEVELRYWLGRKAALKPLQGHHIGLYARMLTYDIEWGDKGYMGDKWSYGAGLDYGYSLPLGRRLNMDFSLGVGYMGGQYEEYTPQDGCYVWQATKNRHFIGLTRAEVSLVWLIGKANVNHRKGGAR